MVLLQPTSPPTPHQDSILMPFNALPILPAPAVVSSSVLFGSLTRSFSVMMNLFLASFSRLECSAVHVDLNTDVIYL